MDVFRRQPTKNQASMDLLLIWASLSNGARSDTKYCDHLRLIPISAISKDAFGPEFTHEVLEKNVYGSNIE